MRIYSNKGFWEASKTASSNIKVAKTEILTKSTQR